MRECCGAFPGAWGEAGKDHVHLPPRRHRFASRAGPPFTLPDQQRGRAPQSCPRRPPARRSASNPLLPPPPAPTASGRTARAAPAPCTPSPGLRAPDRTPRLCRGSPPEPHLGGAAAGPAQHPAARQAPAPPRPTPAGARGHGAREGAGHGSRTGPADPRPHRSASPHRPPPLVSSLGPHPTAPHPEAASGTPECPPRPPGPHR